MNAVEREPVETRVLNPTASEASYKSKQRSYRKTNLKKKVLAPDIPGAEMSSAETYPTRPSRPPYNESIASCDGQQTSLGITKPLHYDWESHIFKL